MSGRDFCKKCRISCRKLCILFSFSDHAVGKQKSSTGAFVASQTQTFFSAIGGQGFLKPDGLGSILVIECNQHLVIVQENGIDKKLENLMKAIEDGLYTRTTKESLEALEIQKDELTAKIADEKLKKPSFNENFIRFWLMKFRKFDISQKKQRKALIEIFVNAIFLYDDQMLITFNYKDGTQTVRFEDTLTADCGEKSLRLRSNESPSGAFERQNGLAQARWRGLAPTSSDLSSLAGS